MIHHRPPILEKRVIRLLDRIRSLSAEAEAGMTTVGLLHLVALG